MTLLDTVAAPAVGPRHRGRRRTLRALARRAAVALGGSLVVLVGLALVPLPGPGWPVVLLGLSLLAREFPWAARLSAAVERRLRDAVQWSRRRLGGATRRGAVRVQPVRGTVPARSAGGVG